MKHSSSFTVKRVNFDNYIKDIHFIRNSVFVQEQKVPHELEWDQLDSSAYHYIVKSDKNKVIAYARLFPFGELATKLGRVAVLPEWRHQGIGRLLVLEICEHAMNLNLSSIKIASQTSVIEFYLQLGFKINGEKFFEAGIEHQAMLKTLK